MVSGIIRVMTETATDGQPVKPRVRDLIAIKISAGYASELLSGKKLPSIEMAKRIEAGTGYPATAWLTEDHAQ